MVEALTKVEAFPTGMRLHEFIAEREGFFRAEGLDVTLRRDILRSQMEPWKDQYKERPQDKVYLEQEGVFGSACAWGSVCNAGSGMGKFVPDVHGIAPWGVFVRPDSKIRRPEDLANVPIAVGLRAGSHFNVPYRLEKYLPLDKIKPVNVGGFGERLRVLLDGAFEAASLLPPQIEMARQLGLRPIIENSFKTLWWVDSRQSPEVLRAYFRALDRAEKALSADPQTFMPLWENSVPMEFRAPKFKWDYAKFGHGERFVHAPISRAEYEEIVDQAERWKLSDMTTRRFEDNALTVAAE
jgi:hypothetical protein